MGGRVAPSLVGVTKTEDVTITVMGSWLDVDVRLGWGLTWYDVEVGAAEDVVGIDGASGACPEDELDDGDVGTAGLAFDDEGAVLELLLAVEVPAADEGVVTLGGPDGELAEDAFGFAGSGHPGRPQGSTSQQPLKLFDTHV